MSHILSVKSRFENGGQMYYKGDKISVQSGERAKELVRKGLATRSEPPQNPAEAPSHGPSETQDNKPDETKKSSDLAATIDALTTHKEVDELQADYLVDNIPAKGKGVTLDDRKAALKAELVQDA